MKAKKLPSGNYRVQVVAGYDDNGKRIVNTAVKKINYTAKEKTGFVSDNISIGNGDSVRAYVWSSLKSPKPVSSRIYTMQ